MPPKNHPHTICVKTLLNPDEFVEFDRECAAADVKHSPLLRDLAKSWLAERKATRAQQQMEWPSPGQNVAMLLPGRPNFGARGQLRMRL